jgi:hypothetical protein
MAGERYNEEFNIAAVKQITEDRDIFVSMEGPLLFEFYPFLPITEPNCQGLWHQLHQSFYR